MDPPLTPKFCEDSNFQSRQRLKEQLLGCGYTILGCGYTKQSCGYTEEVVDILSSSCKIKLWIYSKSCGYTVIKLSISLQSLPSLSLSSLQLSRQTMIGHPPQLYSSSYLQLSLALSSSFQLSLLAISSSLQLSCQTMIGHPPQLHISLVYLLSLSSLTLVLSLSLVSCYSLVKASRL